MINNDFHRKKDWRIHVIIPAFNEEQSIEKVLNAIPDSVGSNVVVVDNGSTDHTAKKAKSAGATVIHEPKMGYGNACLAGIHFLRKKIELKSNEIVVFLDADFSDYPEEIEKLVQPIEQENFDLVIGSRVLGDSETGALLPQQRFGNWLATRKTPFASVDPISSCQRSPLLLHNYTIQPGRGI